MWHALGILAARLRGLALLLGYFQSHLVFYPGTGARSIATPAQLGLPYEDIHLKTSDGISLQWLGISGLASRAARSCFCTATRGISPTGSIRCRCFHRLGYSTLIFDYRGYGNSAARPRAGHLSRCPRPHGAT